MGAAASVPSGLEVRLEQLGDAVTAKDCREIAALIRWGGDVEDWIDDVFDDEETISKKKLMKKIAKEQKKMEVGESNRIG